MQRGNLFFISDHHFNHEKILQFEGKNRPFATLDEMKQGLIDRHNSVVTDNDFVWFLGDLIFGENANFYELAAMKGRKGIVFGNHETSQKIKQIVESGVFDKFASSFDIKTPAAKYVVSHRPIHTWEMDVDKRVDFCIHGHLHSDSIPDDRFVCVSVEQIDLTPISFDQIRSNLRAKGFKNA